MARVADKTAIVTGAGSGIGRAIATTLAAEGARLLLTDLNEASVQETLAAVAEAGGEALALAHDVTDEAAWSAVVAQAQDRFGGLHILVNNAGIGGEDQAQNPETVTLENWRRVNAVNLEGVMLGCRTAIPAIRAAGGGAIVNLSSLASRVATPYIAAYGASKAGVAQYSKSVALHCAQRRANIRCNSIHPGPIQTPMLERLFALTGRDAEDGRRRLLRAVPLHAFGTPQDVANAVLFLASDDSRYITGAELAVDGGASMI